MLIVCPNCGAQIAVGGLTPHTMAACPLCRGLFQVPQVEIAPTSWAPPPQAPLAPVAASPVEPGASTELPDETAPTEQLTAQPPGNDTTPLLPEPTPPATLPVASTLPPSTSPPAEADRPGWHFTPAVPPPQPTPAPQFSLPAAPTEYDSGAGPTMMFTMPAAVVPATGRRTTGQGNTRSLGKWIVYLTVFALMMAVSAVGTYVFVQREKDSTPVPVEPTVVNRIEPPRSERVPPIGAAAPADATTKWNMVQKFSGQGMRKTAQFRISKPRWRLVWSTRTLPGQSSDNFAILVDNPAGTQLASAASIVGTGEGTAYVQLPPGRYLLEILAFNSSWEVTVEEPE